MRLTSETPAIMSRVFLKCLKQDIGQARCSDGLRTTAWYHFIISVRSHRKASPGLSGGCILGVESEAGRQSLDRVLGKAASREKYGIYKTCTEAHTGRTERPHNPEVAGLSLFEDCPD